MATLQQYYNTGDNGLFGIIDSTNWKSQSFTTGSSAYTLYSVKLLMYRAGTPNTITVSLRATTGTLGARYPTGADLVSGTTNGNTLTTNTAGEWREIVFSESYNVLPSTEYAICVRCAGSNPNVIYLREDEGAGYSSGNEALSANSGSTWTPDVDDALFESWGTTIVPIDKVYSRALVAIGANEVWYESSAGTMSELSAANGALNLMNPLGACEAYQKLFIVNETNKKIADFVNTKIATTSIGANLPDIGTVLTGGTSAAAMVVDFIDAGSGATNVYGHRTTTATFQSGETVTGTNDAGSAVSFATSAAETSPPHWYNWIPYANNSTTYGTFLTKPTLICLYRGRLVISGDSRIPHAWQMTKVGNPFKVLYDFSNDADLSAITYTNTKVGLIGDIITALIPYKDDLLVFGCANSIWILIGDPLSEGQLAEITHSTGIWGPLSWCMDDHKNIYFLGHDGIYQMPVGETSNPPTNISKAKLPQLMTSLDLDKSLHRVVLSYDPVENGIIISKTLISDGTNTNYFYSLLTGGFFPESYPTSCGIFCSYYYPATDETYKKFLVGGQDGYIREFDPVTKNDTTTASTEAISSYCTVVQPLGQDESLNGLLKEIRGIVAGGASSGDFSDTDGVSLSLYKGADAETVLEDIKDGADAFTTITWSSTGKQNISRPRMKGSWVGIKLYNSTASQTWALEKLFGDIVPKGKA